MGRLAFVATGYIVDYDGVSVYIENILRLLLSEKSIVKGDIKVDIFAKEDSIELLKKRVLMENSKYIRFITVTDNRYLKFLDLQMKILQQSYNLVFVPTPMPLFFSRGKRIKVIHDLTIKKTPEYFSKPFHLYIDFLINYMLKKDFGIGYISQQTKDDIERFYTAKNANLIYLPNGIPFKVQQNKRPALESIFDKYNSGELRFVVVGRINHAKGFDRILDFLTYFDNHHESERFKSITVDIAGKQTKETKDLFLNKNFKNIKLNFHGYVDDDTLNQLYKNSHFCFFLSRNEGYGLPLVEALWFGSIPVISDIPVFGEIVGKNYPKFDDKSGYTDAIKEFVVKSYFDKTYQKKLFEDINKIVEKEKNGYKRSVKKIVELSS